MKEKIKESQETNDVVSILIPHISTVDPSSPHLPSQLSRA